MAHKPSGEPPGIEGVAVPEEREWVGAAAVGWEPAGYERGCAPVEAYIAAMPGWKSDLGRPP